MSRLMMFRRTGYGWEPARKSSYWSLGVIFVLLGAFALTLLAFEGGQVSTIAPRAQVTSSINLLEPMLSAASWRNRSFEGIFQAVLPTMNGSTNKLPDFRSLLQTLFSLGAEATIGHPKTFLTAQLPLMYNTPEPEKTPVSRSTPVGKPEDQSKGIQQKETTYPPAPLTGGPLVLIYNTHTGETYEKTDGLDRLPGKRGGVFLAAEALAGELENKHGIKVIQSETIHDDNFLMDNPYSKSYKTVSQLLQENPSIKIVVDVHRDAGVARKYSVVKINGEEVASTMLVVGTNARQNHPNWQKNYTFAQQLGKHINEKYPGLLRKIVTQRGRYNQHLHPQAILLEIGSTENTTEEAIKSARLIADVLADELTNLKNQ